MSLQQRGRGMMTYPGRGWRRRLFRGPLLLWRMGLGPVFSRAPFRFLVLATRGRKSGQARYTALEHTAVEGRICIAPGWGERTQWYQNILADPRVTVQLGNRAQGALARRVTDDAELAALYHHAHGKSPAWKSYLESWGVADTLEDFLDNKDRLVTLCLDPIRELPLPPLQRDLLWVWPILAAGALAGCVLLLR